MKSEKAICPKCHKTRVYSEHKCKDDTWRIYCECCGLTTDIYPTYNAAHAEWEQLEKRAKQLVH
jgi:ribosomal protein S27AE